MMRKTYKNLFLMAAICVIGSLNLTGFSQDKFLEWSLDPAVRSMRLVGVDESTKFVTFILSNASDKVVTAYSVCFGSAGSHSDCHGSDWFTHEISAGLRIGDIDRLSISSREALQYEDKIIELSVLFEDGTNEGKMDNIALIELKRLGRALETQRIGEIAESFAKKDLTDADLQSFVEQIGSAQSRVDHQVMNDVLIMKEKYLQELILPDLPISPPLFGVSLISGVNGSRHDMLRAIDDMRKLPLSSEKTSAITRRIYLSGLLERWNVNSVRQLEICRRSRFLRPRVQ